MPLITFSRRAAEAQFKIVFYCAIYTLSLTLSRSHFLTKSGAAPFPCFPPQILTHGNPGVTSRVLSLQSQVKVYVVVVIMIAVDQIIEVRPDGYISLL